MDRWVGKVCVITGASSGIGLGIAKALVHEGMIVFGLARRIDLMEESMKNIKGKGKFHAIQCDVGNEDEVSQAFTSIKKNFQTVHLLINNAGTLQFNATLADVASDRIRQILAVNVLGLLYCSRNAISLMREGDHEGQIINISSVVGLPNIVPPVVPLNIYTGTKRAVAGISETFRSELLGGKIRVTTINPGLVKSEIIPQEVILTDFPILDSADIANSVIYILSTPPHVHVTELTIRPLGEKM